MCIRIHMVKVISLSNKAYATLKAFKQGDDSFSDVVMKLTEKKKPSIMDLAGKWKISDKETEKIKREIEQGRKRAKLREVHF
jgi:predicted CopG family antitoxin